MFTDDMPKIVSGYFKVLETVADHFKADYAIERLSRQGELALVFTTASGGKLLYLGMRWDLWSRMNLPLWLGVRPEWSAGRVDAFSARNQGRSFMHDGYQLSPVDPGIATDTASAEALIGLIEAELAAAQLAGP